MTQNIEKALLAAEVLKRAQLTKRYKCPVQSADRSVQFPTSRRLALAFSCMAAESPIDLQLPYHLLADEQERF